MSRVEAPKPLKNWAFGDFVHYAGRPKVADAVIEAILKPTLSNLCRNFLNLSTALFRLRL
jgi:hypothetical protein